MDFSKARRGHEAGLGSCEIFVLRARRFDRTFDLVRIPSCLDAEPQLLMPQLDGNIPIRFTLGHSWRSFPGLPSVSVIQGSVTGLVRGMGRDTLATHQVNLFSLLRMWSNSCT
jgi:hypothetical protein